MCILHTQIFRAEKQYPLTRKTKRRTGKVFGTIPITLPCVKKEKETVCSKFWIFKFELIHISHECAIGVTVRNSESEIDCMNLLTFTLGQTLIHPFFSPARWADWNSLSCGTMITVHVVTLPLDRLRNLWRDSISRGSLCRPIRKPTTRQPKQKLKIKIYHPAKRYKKTSNL